MANARFHAVSAALALCACGLVDPPAPPARLVGGTVPGAALPSGGGAPPFPGGGLAFDDEFEGAAVDPRSWTIAVGPRRQGVSSVDSVEVANGVLELVTFTTPDGVHHTPALSTQGKVELEYGYYEARIRYLDSAGEWCSWFLWPKTYGNPPGDPGRAGVEIDIAEHRDADDNGWNVRDMVQVGLNWDRFGLGWPHVNLLVAHPLGAPLSHEWHTYSVLWTESGTTFYIDDLPVWSTSAAVSHRTEAMWLTCEVENGSWAGYVPKGGYGPRDSSTTRMEVDWVRVWQPAN